MRTPSTVSDVSAMSVDSTTRRRPGGDGASARSCSSRVSAPARAYTSTSAGMLGGIVVDEHPFDTPDLADAGEEHEHVAVVGGERSADRVDDVGFDRVEATRSRRSLRTAAAPPAATAACRRATAGRTRQPAHVDVEHPAVAREDGGLEHPLQTLGVRGGRHCDDRQVGTDRGCDLDGERERRVGGQVALVDLVEDDRADAGQRRVVLQSACQHALGQHLDAGVGADVPLVARLVADEGPDRGARRRRHPLGGGAGGQTARLEHHDAPALQPRFVEEGERYDGGLARARGSDDDRPPVRGQRTPEVVEDVDDRQVGQVRRASAPHRHPRKEGGRRARSAEGR